jgi:transposase
MRKADTTQHALFSYGSLEERVPANHPLRKLRILVDGILLNMSAEIGQHYSSSGRPSIVPERLLRASLIQTLFTIRSERQLVEHIEYNMLYRWFVGMNLDDPVWHHSTFSANRDRLFSEAIAQRFFNHVLNLAQWQNLVSEEHFTVDGTLIEAWASAKSYVKKDGSGKPSEDGGRNPSVDFKGEKRLRETHESKTDPEALLYKKSPGDKAKLSYIGHALMENRHGLVVDVVTTQATGTAERDAALLMAGRSIPSSGATLGADTGYDTEEFVGALRKLGVAPHIAQKKDSVSGDLPAQPGYEASLKTRKRVEEIFGWSKTIGGLRKARFVGLAKVKVQTILTFAAYNLVRMATIFGWRLSGKLG